jgi:hypothetical protein
MRHLTMIAAVLAMSIASLAVANAAPSCKTGVPCGNSCIAKGKTCHISAAPQCKTGKPCGKTCIKKSDQCHIK